MSHETVTFPDAEDQGRALAEFLARHARPYDPATDDNERPPFAADIKEGKNDPIYNAHSYHTKVPPRSIIPYILHYSQPGDLVLDPFCGSGMTGVAAQMCSRTRPLTCLCSFPNSPTALARVPAFSTIYRPRPATLHTTTTRRLMLTPSGANSNESRRQ